MYPRRDPIQKTLVLSLQQDGDILAFLNIILVKSTYFEHILTFLDVILMKSKHFCYILTFLDVVFMKSKHFGKHFDVVWCHFNEIHVFGETF